MITFQSGDKTIRLDQIEPAGPGPFPAVLLVHGSGGNISFWLDSIAPFITRLGVALYAVHYFERTGTIRADTATILDGVHVPLWLDTLSDALEAIAARPTVNPRRIALLGISLGAFLSLAHATLPNRRRVRAIVEVSGGLDGDYIAGATATFPPTLILHGEQDTIVPVSRARTLDDLLTRLDIPHQIQLFPNEGHHFSPTAQLRILQATATFLGKRL
ncbi:alpha/beta hydrolase family protein [Granulicella arctica]|uniref:alpha/beta hydrolase family protein n=1 Tax=Granulicella arctica TaxID=940613 RepID=UPI0021E040C9|nr:alpha/beta fold hydrolase [Granulicella arctica]